jgi:peroxiredoxin
MLTRRLSVALIALAIAGVAAIAAYADLSVGTKAPNFTLPTIDGKTFTLADNFKAPGKVVVLDLWATWCPPCRAEIPHLINLQSKFKNKRVTIVGVSLDRGKAEVVDFAKEQGINYIVAHDPNGEKVGGAYQVRGIPATYIIDKSGVIRYAHSGFPRDAAEAKRKAAEFEKQINTLLAQK